MSVMGFKAKVDFLTSVLHLLCTTDSWWPSWQLSHFEPHTCIQALVEHESGIEHASALTLVLTVAVTLETITTTYACVRTLDTIKPFVFLFVDIEQTVYLVTFCCN